jgi:hypothetical protein
VSNDGLDFPNLNDDAIPSDQFPWVAALNNNTWRPSGPEDADRPRYPGISVPTRGDFWPIVKYASAAMKRAGVEEEDQEAFAEEAIYGGTMSRLLPVLARRFTLTDGTAVVGKGEYGE